MILVPTDTPGFNIIRAVPVMGSGGVGGHCEIRFENCRVPLGNLLGESGAGIQAGPGSSRSRQNSTLHALDWCRAAQF